MTRNLVLALGLAALLAAIALAFAGYLDPGAVVDYANRAFIC